MSVNQLTIDGNITTEVEYNISQNGKGQPYLKFSIANNEYVKNNNNGYDQISSFYNVVTFGKNADTVQSINLRKGQRVLIMGKLSQNIVTDKNSGKRITYISIIASKVLPIDINGNRINNNNNNNNNNYNNQNYNQNNNYRNNNNNQNGNQQMPNFDESEYEFNENDYEFNEESFYNNGGMPITGDDDLPY